ncbi:MAG: ATP-binding cassette domain-containing protein [Treponemataceae bacterium]|nr:ATP-binding cassette domain-containing protein [Treponemataceae bacterium]
MLQLKNVTKSYGKDFCAVNDLSFTAEEGAVVGVIGPNGAGKSTTIRMIMDIIKPDSGTITLDGKPFTAEDKDKIGYLPEERGLYKKEKVCDVLRYLAALKGVSKADADARIDKWLARFDLSEWKDKKIESLSKGMAQKIQFISTVLHDPKIVFLDEPFSGLDPVSSDELLAVIKELKQEGRIILFSTHVMEVAERICDHIIMLNHGQKILDGNLAQIRKEYGNNSVTVECEGDGSFLKDIPGVKSVQESGSEYTLTLQNDVNEKDLFAAVAAKAQEKDCTVSRYMVNEPSLHAVFVSIAGKESLSDDVHGEEK